jgi:hypothetical protein
MANFKKKIDELQDLKMVVTKRLSSNGPCSDLELPDDVLGRLKSRYQSNDSAGTDSSALFYNSPSFYTAGAACGG